MNYDLTRLDGSDPSYAPGMKKPVKGLFYWAPPQADIKAGYAIRSMRLPGRSDDGRDMERAAKARDLTRELLRWREDQSPKVQHGTWQWIIGRYKSDDFSPIHDVKGNTRNGYLEQARYWENAIGAVLIAETDFATIKNIQRGMQAKGRSDAFIQRAMSSLRRMVGYGVKIDPSLFRDVRDVLAEMTFRGSSRRNVCPTRDQVFAIIAEANKDGNTLFALGLELQWWLACRSIDIRGDKINGQWQDGLTWGMVDLDLGTITKTPSKTEKYMPEAITWDLSAIHHVIAALRAIPPAHRIGPVIRNTRGNTYDKRSWADTFAKYRALAGVPEEIKAMDVRAGAITDAKRNGATAIQMRDAANHSSVQTTNRYIRDRNASVNQVIQMRNGTKP
jgi:hypothetical protein